MGLEAKNPFENDDELEGQEARATEVDSVVTLSRIHHVAIAVVDLDIALDHYRSAFGATVDSREILDEDHVEVALLRLGESYLALMTPTSDDADLAAFLDEWGPGLHHVGYEVDDLEAAMASLADSGYEVVDTEPRPGPAGTRTAYVNPHDVDGAIFQLVGA